MGTAEGNQTILNLICVYTKHSLAEKERREVKLRKNTPEVVEKEAFEHCSACCCSAFIGA